MIDARTHYQIEFHKPNETFYLHLNKKEVIDIFGNEIFYKLENRSRGTFITIAIEHLKEVKRFVEILNIYLNH